MHWELSNIWGPGWAINHKFSIGVSIESMLNLKNTENPSGTNTFHELFRKTCRKSGRLGNYSLTVMQDKLMNNFSV